MRINNPGSDPKTEKTAELFTIDYWGCPRNYPWQVGNFQGLSGYLIAIWKAPKLQKACNKIDEEQNTKMEP